MIAVMVLFMFGIAFGETNKLSMITSRPALKAWAIEQVKYVSGSVSSPSMVNFSSTKPWFNIENKSAGVLDIAFSVVSNRLTFEVANPNDPLWLHVSYQDKNHEYLFWGSRDSRLKKDAGGTWYVEDVAVELDLSDRIAIPIKNVSYGRMIIRDSAGRISGNAYLEARDGKLYFPSRLAGSKGELIVSYWDYEDQVETNQVFNLSTGETQTTTAVGSVLFPILKDVWDFGEDPQSVSVYIEPSSVKPLVQATYSSPRKTIVKATASDGKVALGVYVRKTGDTNWKYFAIPEDVGFVQVDVLKGIYFFIFDFGEEDLPQVYSGGKG